MPKVSIYDKMWLRVKNDSDVKSFAELHGFFYPVLVEFAFSYLKIQLSCEEVVDDVFVNLWEKRDKLENIRNIKSYLYTCTRNKALDYLRKNNQEPNFESDLFVIESIKYENEVDADVENEEFIEMLQIAIDQLPTKCKMIFKMHINDNLKNAEIAEIMGIAKKTVEAQIYIAYQKLTCILKKVYNAA